MNIKRIATVGLMAATLVATGAPRIRGDDGPEPATDPPTTPASCLPAGHDDTWPGAVDGAPALRSRASRVWHDATGWHVRVTHNTMHDRVFSGEISHDRGADRRARGAAREERLRSRSARAVTRSHSASTTTAASTASTSRRTARRPSRSASRPTVTSADRAHLDRCGRPPPGARPVRDRPLGVSLRPRVRPARRAGGCDPGDRNAPPPPLHWRSPRIGVLYDRARRPAQRGDHRPRRPRQDHPRRRPAVAVRRLPREPGRQRAGHGLERPRAREGHHDPRQEHRGQVRRRDAQHRRHARPRRLRRRGRAGARDGRRRAAPRRRERGPAAADPLRAAQDARGAPAR